MFVRLACGVGEWRVAMVTAGAGMLHVGVNYQQHIGGGEAVQTTLVGTDMVRSPPSPPSCCFADVALFPLPTSVLRGPPPPC